MRVFLALLLILGSVQSCLAAASTTPSRAKATLINAQGQPVGTAALEEQVLRGVKIRLDLHDVAPGQHAFHIHGIGQCDPPDFQSAGPHYNPTGKQHGVDNPMGHHAGDLPNLTADSDGKIQAELLVDGVTLGPGEYSLFDADGSALVLHANADDHVTDPAGNAGARVACGVITE